MKFLQHGKMRNSQSTFHKWLLGQLIAAQASNDSSCLCAEFIAYIVVKEIFFFSGLQATDGTKNGQGCDQLSSKINKLYKARLLPSEEEWDWKRFFVLC